MRSGTLMREERPGHTGRFPAIGPALDLGQPLGNAGLAQQHPLGVVVQGAGDQAIEQLLGCVVREHLERRELAVPVLGIMAAGLVQVDLAYVGSVHGLVTAFDQLGLHECLENPPDDGPFGHPEDESLSHQRRDREEAQLLADLAMIALPGLLELREMGVELFLVEEGRAVDALEHLAVGLSLPVGAGDGEELERPDLAGVGDVGAAAEIDEFALAIEAEHAELMQLAVDMLDLEGLAQVGDELAGLVHRQREPLERLRILEDARHLGLDGWKVVLGKAAAVDLDVVVEAAGRGRSKREPDSGKEPHDRPRHDVRRGVAQDVERLAVLRGQDSQLDRPGRGRPVLERPIEVNDRAVGHRRHGRLGQPLADARGHLTRPGPIGVFLDRTIRQLDLEHRRPHLRSRWVAW